MLQQEFGGLLLNRGNRGGVGVESDQARREASRAAAHHSAGEVEFQKLGEILKEG